MVTARSCAIMQPYFLPYIGYFQLINAVDVFVPYGRVNFMVQSWVSRNRILGPSDDLYIRPATKGASPSKIIADITIDPANWWRRKMFFSFKHLYSNAPYAHENWGLLERIIYHQAPTLDAYNTYGIRQIVAHLGIETEILGTQDIPATIEPHVRTLTDPSVRKQTRVTEICDAINVDTYVNPASGQHLYSADHFAPRDKNLLFLEPDLQAAAQQLETPRADLSIAHCLMMSGKEKLREALACCTILPARHNA